MITMTDVKEQTRSYHWPDGTVTEFKNVVQFSMPGSTHRLKTADGNLHIVKTDWRYITISGAKDFTV